MATNLVKFCTAALAGTIIGITYERWPADFSYRNFNSLGWPIGMVAASESSLLTPPPSSKTPFFGGGDFIDKVGGGGGGGGGGITPVDPKVAAENFRQSSTYGLPSKDNIRLFNDFIISYDRRLRAPIWVIEHMTPEKLSAENNVRRDNSKFVADTMLHEYFRGTLADFKGSGYDRGHMAAAGNHKVSQSDMDQTFILSNISPQEQEFNRGGWEILESYVRWRAKRSSNLYVVTGPLYLPQKKSDGHLYVTYRVIGKNLVSVPTHYFKVILTQSKNGTMSMEAFLMPNDPKMDRSIRLDDYRVPIKRLDVIERSSGVIFFDQLPRDKIDAPHSLPKEFKPRPQSFYDDRNKDKPSQVTDK